MVSVTAEALCGVIQQALFDKGIDPQLAKELAERACEPRIEGAVRTIKQTGKRTKRKLSAYDRALKKALRQVNDKARTKSGKLRKGMTQATIMKRAHKIAKRMIK